jgi:splicing factor 3A subunit 1
MAPGLDLPPPSADANAKHATVEDVQDVSIGSAPTASAPPSKTNANRFATGGIIYPPPEIRNIIEKTASFIARLGKQFEERMKSEDKAGKLSFLSEDDPYHAFYEHTLQNGGSTKPDGSQQPADGEDAEIAEAQPNKEDESMPEPESYMFSAELPSTTAVDL